MYISLRKKNLKHKLLSRKHILFLNLSFLFFRSIKTLFVPNWAIDNETVYTCVYDYRSQQQPA